MTEDQFRDNLSNNFWGQVSDAVRDALTPFTDPPGPPATVAMHPEPMVNFSPDLEKVAAQDSGWLPPTKTIKLPKQTITGPGPDAANLAAGAAVGFGNLGQLLLISGAFLAAWWVFKRR